MPKTAISKKFPLHLSEFWPNIVHTYCLGNIFNFIYFFHSKHNGPIYVFVEFFFFFKSDVTSINYSQVKLKHNLFFSYITIYLWRDLWFVPS